MVLLYRRRGRRTQSPRGEALSGVQRHSRHGTEKKQTKKMQEILGSYGPNLSVPAKPIRQLSEE